MPQLLSGGEGKPESGPDHFTALSFIQECSCMVEAPGEDWDWPEACLLDTIRYLRGSKLLSMPADLKAAFPARV